MKPMYSPIQMAFKYLRYWFTASNGSGHGIHSPHVYTFVEQVLIGRIADWDGFSLIRSVRKQLCSNPQELKVEDFGAGSVSKASASRSVSSIARLAAKPDRFGRLFYRIIRYYQIESVLELGTSLGLTTRYLALAGPAAGVVTLEGAGEIAKFSQSCFDREGRVNIRVIQGNFDQTLEKALHGMKGRKFIFFDGNHRYAPTIRYFQQALEVMGEDDIFVFDDIHWSGEMERAWDEIKKNEKVSCTVDLFFVGIVFFKKAFKEKQEFTIRF